MTTTTAKSSRHVTAEDRLSALQGPAASSAPVHQARPAEIDAETVIHELTRLGVSRPEPLIDLNPEIIDVRGERRAPVVISECPVCDGRFGLPTFEIRGSRHTVLTCEECGLGRLDPLPTVQELKAFYPPQYYGSPGAKFEPLTEAVVRGVGAIHVRALTRSLPRGARVLDVGCGRGVLLNTLADRGFETHGMDVSDAAVEGADPRARIQVAPCLTQVGYPANHFDQVILWHVLEHLSNPREVLREVHRIVKPGGRVIVAVPNFSSLQARWAGAGWFHLDLPRHLFHFPVAGIRQLLDRTMFDVVREQHFSLRQDPFGWVQSALNRSGSSPRNALYRLLHKDGVDNGVSPSTQRRLKAAYLAGMPLAGLLSLLTASVRSGATVCLVGQAN
ncbi:MAG: class I SAM-dependent methyltransferase [Planctomycetaceae bacterium]|nr:class I SAM-dependent methyltransferase [Planctomycetaceae bacterium]